MQQLSDTGPLSVSLSTDGKILIKDKNGKELDKNKLKIDQLNTVINRLKQISLSNPSKEFYAGLTDSIEELNKNYKKRNPLSRIFYKFVGRSPRSDMEKLTQKIALTHTEELDGYLKGVKHPEQVRKAYWIALAAANGKGRKEQEAAVEQMRSAITKILGNPKAGTPDETALKTLLKNLEVELFKAQI